MSFEVIDPVQHASALAEITPVGSVWRHRAGHEYRVCGHCTLEATVEAAVLYQRVEGDGPTWARMGHEFCDGRFSKIADPDALQPAPMSVAEAWQPIDTAPKDTKARLIWCPSNRCVFCACWEKGGTPGYKAGWAVFGGGWRECLQGATHWMPLPEPPALASPEGE